MTRRTLVAATGAAAVAGLRPTCAQTRKVARIGVLTPSVQQPQAGDVVRCWVDWVTSTGTTWSSKYAPPMR